MKHLRVSLGSLSALLLLALPLTAALEFPTTRLTYEAGINQASQKAVFPFTNTGEAAITITKIGTSCGCTTAELEKKTYAPGESGEIEAVFDFGARRGLQKKTVTVNTDDPDTPYTQLFIEVDIPERYTVDPRVLQWYMGNPREPKSTRIEIHEELAVDTVEVEPVEDGDRFETRVERLERGHGFAVVMIPKDMSTRQRSSFRLHFKGEDAELVGTISLFAIVR